MNSSHPRVSVILAAYNGQKYLREAIDSILSQTFSDFEFILIDDGSTDQTLEIIQSYARKDGRIKVIVNAVNLGLMRSLNQGLALARGDYIARMDSDDISLPERFTEQLAYMDAHPEIGVSGTWVELFGDIAGEIWKYPTGHDAICASMLFSNTLVHPSVMMRSETLQRHHLQYDPNMLYAEDYEFWSRVLFVTKLANLDRVLLKYRIHAQSEGVKNLEKQHQTHAAVYRRLLSPLRLEFSAEELHLHQQIGTYSQGDDPEFLQHARLWLEKLQHANQYAHIFPPGIFSAELGKRWTGLCQQSHLRSVALLRQILASPIPFEGRTGLRKWLPVFRFVSARTFHHSGRVFTK